MPKYNIPLRVRNLVKKYGTANPVFIARMLNIHIRYVDTPAQVNGFWLKILRRKFIFVNANLAEWQSNAVVAHELAHIILHPHYRLFSLEGRSYYSKTSHEDEANRFSAELLQYMDIDKCFTMAFLDHGWHSENTKSPAL